MEERSMADYVVELGLDGNVAPKTDGSYPLMQSVARKESAGWSPAWYTAFEPGDRVAFRFADYTNAGKDVHFVPAMILISFRKPDDPTQLSYPFKEKVNPISISSEFALGSGQGSIVLPASLGAKADYWYLIDQGSGDEAFFQFAKAKSLLRFLLRFEIAVRYGDQLRLYGHDPEIFVGEGGKPGPSGRWPRRRA
jgi:hypothetical protein